MIETEESAQTTDVLEARLIKLLGLDALQIYLRVVSQLNDESKRYYITERLKLEAFTRRDTIVQSIKEETCNNSIARDALNNTKRTPSLAEISEKQMSDKLIEGLKNIYGVSEEFFDNFKHVDEWKRPSTGEFFENLKSIENFEVRRENINEEQVPIHTDEETLKLEATPEKSNGFIEAFSSTPYVANIIDRTICQTRRLGSNGVDADGQHVPQCEPRESVVNYIEEIIDIMAPTLTPEQRKRVLFLMMKISI